MLSGSAVFEPPLGPRAVVIRPGGRRLSAAQVLQQAPYAQRLARLISNTAAPAVAHNKAVMQWLRKEVLLLPEEEEARPEAYKAVRASVCASLVHA